MKEQAKGQNFSDLRAILILILAICLLCLLWSGYFFKFFKLAKERAKFIYLLYYLSNGIVCLYLIKIIFRHNFLLKNLSKEESSIDQVEIDSYKEQIKRLKMERHDFKNQLQTIYTMLELNKIDEVKIYLKDLCSDLEEIKESLIDDSLLPIILLPKKKEAKEAGIDLEINLTADLQQVTVPQKKLFRILFNLIDNALDVLTKSSQDQKLIEVKFLDNQNNINLIVENNGPTIPESLLANIFEAGYSTKGEGRGFGLYIVKSLLEEYGGKIDVTNRKGIITQFVCTLPKEQRG